MLIALIVIVVSILVLIVGVLLYWSPGKIETLVDKDGNEIEESISEKIYVDINGIKQGMVIKGIDKKKPVLLFLHGGPGIPEYPLTQKYPTGLEELFTVCWWEQRGTGLSFSSDIPKETINMEQMISDTIEVTKYLCKRFGKEKVYLLGHSWGSCLGIQTVKYAPDLYYAYIGTAQIWNQIESEKIAYKYMLDQYKKNGNNKMIRCMEKHPIGDYDYIPKTYLNIRDKVMHDLGVGTTHDMKSVISGLFMDVMRNTEYTLGEKMNIWYGMVTCKALEEMQMEAFKIDFSVEVPKLNVPTYFLHGVYDYTICYEGAKKYFNKLQTPLKGFYTFEKSAHSPVFEEPEKVREILKEDVLKGYTKLSDAQ